MIVLSLLCVKQFLEGKACVSNEMVLLHRQARQENEAQCSKLPKKGNMNN